MKVYFARHGRTNYNDLGLCNADPSVDVHLTSLGKKQAQTLADELKHAPIERIFVSELKRTQQTAEAVNTFHHVDVQTDARLDDIRTGFEGKDCKEFGDALDAAADRWNARFNDGESVEDMKKRVAAFLDELKTKPYDTVLVITSQWVVYAAFALIKGVSNEDAWKLDVQQGAYIEVEL